VIVDDEVGSVSNAFGLSAFPFWVAIDSTGTIVFRAAGALGVSEYEGLVQALAGT
jgi:hypothetical protein